MFRFDLGFVGRPKFPGGLDLQTEMNISSHKEKRSKVGLPRKIAITLQCPETEYREERETCTREEQNDEEFEPLSTTLPPRVYTVGHLLLFDVNRYALSSIIEMYNLNQRPRLNDESCRHVVGVCTIRQICRVYVQIRLVASMTLPTLQRVLLGDFVRVAVRLMSLVLKVGFSF